LTIENPAVELTETVEVTSPSELDEVELPANQLHDT
jgi:hypothetical protein